MINAVGLDAGDSLCENEWISRHPMAFQVAVTETVGMLTGRHLIPHGLTWHVEHIAEPVSAKYHRLSNISELPGLIAGVESPR